MIFNKTAYYIPDKTKNNTNLKGYSSILNDFTISTVFKLNDFLEDEVCVICKEGYPMGIFLEAPNFVKFVWYTKENKYNEIKLSVENIKEIINIKVSVSEFIKLYLNGDLIVTKERGEIIDYSERRLLIGAQCPFNGKDEKWFNGEINEVIIYNSCVDNTEKNMYINIDFKENSKFKTFDKSGNGNHGILIEDPEYINYSINKFNNVAPKQKII